MFRTELCALLLSALAALPASAQYLRHGIWAADLVVVADVVGVQPLGNDIFLWRLRPLRALKGTAPERITIVEQKNVSDRPKPVANSTRLYCLKPDGKVELPKQHGPFFRMTGFRGDHPVVELDAETREPAGPWVRLAEALIASEDTASPRATCDALIAIALAKDGPARTEAVQVLRERNAIRDRIDAVQKNDLLARAIGETEDASLKDALASLCAELKMDGVIEALCMSIENEPDVAFATTLGRLANYVHGEKSAELLRKRILENRDAKARECLMLALGATQTEAALQTLLHYRQINGPGEAVDAALRAHGSRRAVDAVAPKRRDTDRQ